jgi:hypothetical protein
VDRPAALFNDPGEFAFVEAFTSQREQQHGADIWMGAQLLHHVLRITVWKASWKPNDMYVLCLEWTDDLLRDVVGAFD